MLEELKREVKEKNLENYIEFIKNPPFSELIKIFKSCSIGIHTMMAEHFGIAVVEMLAAGLIVIAHNSAGPKMDIIKNNEVGFLCDTEDDYVEALIKSIALM